MKYFLPCSNASYGTWKSNVSIPDLWISLQFPKLLAGKHVNNYFVGSYSQFRDIEYDWAVIFDKYIFGIRVIKEIKKQVIKITIIGLQIRLNFFEG